MMNCHKDKDCKDNNFKQVGLKGILKMSACCWVPMLAFLILSAIGISASGLLLLACPLMMIYMMWAMGRMQQKEKGTSNPTSHMDIPIQEVDSVPQTKELK